MKNTNKQLFNLKIYLGVFLFTLIFFTIYEINIIKNPFFDPIPPYILWIAVSIIGILFSYKITIALKKEK